MDFSLQNLIYKSLIEEILKSRSRDNHDITINSFDMNSNKAFWNITCMYQQTLICLFYVTRHRVIWINITVWKSMSLVVQQQQFWHLVLTNWIDTNASNSFLLSLQRRNCTITWYFSITENFCADSCTISCFWVQLSWR